MRVMPGDHMLSKDTQGFEVVPGSEELEGPDPYVTKATRVRTAPAASPLAKLIDRSKQPRARGLSECRELPWLRSRHTHGERAPALRVHRRFVRGGSTRTFELDITADAVWVEEFAEEDGAAVAELRHEVPKLVSSVGERDRLGMLRHTFSAKNLDALRLASQSGLRPSSTARARD